MTYTTLSGRRFCCVPCAEPAPDAPVREWRRWRSAMRLWTDRSERYARRLDRRNPEAGALAAQRIAAAFAALSEGIPNGNP